jgi:flagellar P-ring protein precursor FlgI
MEVLSMNRRIYISVLALLLVLTTAVGSVFAADAPLVRVKDIARVQGVRDNQLYGLGLVIGLNGTGDSSSALANVQMVANMLERFGITVSPDDLRLRNVAAVMVTAAIPASVRVGDAIDVTVSSIGDARSLQGGFLLQTPLQAANGEIYAAAQGPLSIGGFVVRGGSSSVQQNHTTVARVPNGAIVEQEIPHSHSYGDEVQLVLNEPDFSTAARLVETINQVFAENIAKAYDQSTVGVKIPAEYADNTVGMIALLEELPIRPDTKARVVINERTGTVVMGADVRIATVAVSHGNLNVRVEADLQISQPPGFVGDTVVGVDYNIDVNEPEGGLMLLSGGSSVEDLVNALNAIGANPRDIIAILQAIKAAGALYGDLIIM